VVVCAPQVPCGSATEKVEQATKVTLNPVSEESSVTDVLNKVTTGQADAGLVYVTDALGAGDKVAKVDFPEAAAAVNTYPIGVLKTAADAAAAHKFVDLGHRGGGAEDPVAGGLRQALTRSAGLPRWLYLPAAAGGDLRSSCHSWRWPVKVDWSQFLDPDHQPNRRSPHSSSA